MEEELNALSDYGYVPGLSRKKRKNRAFQAIINCAEYTEDWPERLALGVVRQAIDDIGATTRKQFMVNGKVTYRLVRDYENDSCRDWKEGYLNIWVESLGLDMKFVKRVFKHFKLEAFI